MTANSYHMTCAEHDAKLKEITTRAQSFPKEWKRHQVLITMLQDIEICHATELKTLKYVGPRGGHNARYIEGWRPSPCQAISRFLPAHLKMPYWSGSAFTPSTAIPACMYEECRMVAQALGYKR